MHLQWVRFITSACTLPRDFLGSRGVLSTQTEECCAVLYNLGVCAFKLLNTREMFEPRIWYGSSVLLPFWFTV